MKYEIKVIVSSVLGEFDNTWIVDADKAERVMQLLDDGERV